MTVYIVLEMHAGRLVDVVDVYASRAKCESRVEQLNSDESNGQLSYEYTQREVEL